MILVPNHLPISTHLIRKFLARLLENDSVGFFAVIGIATLLIAIKGAGAGTVWDTMVSATINEAGLPVTALELSQNQLVDMNSVVGNGGVGGRPVKPGTLATIQESSLIGYQTADTDALDEDKEEANGMRSYEVQEGDVLSAIAFDYGLHVQTLVAANNLRDRDVLKPGAILKIPPIDGVVHAVKSGDTVSSLAKKYRAEGEKIIAFNDLPLSGDLRIGQELIIPGGVVPPTAVATVRSVSGSKRFAGLPKFDGYYVTPATCVITQLAHVRNGYDCANKTGTPIYAAASGQAKIAAKSGWNSGFGREIVLTHANGTETLYGHLSQVLVAVGETVDQGQLIGYMGNTGKSTGPHLHFEIHGAYNILTRYGIRAQVSALQR